MWADQAGRVATTANGDDSQVNNARKHQSGGKATVNADGHHVDASAYSALRACQLIIE